MNTISKGRLGYNIVEWYFLQNNYDIYVPLLENTKIDLITVKNNNLLKFQIKTFIYEKGYKKLPVRKVSHNQGQYKISKYTKKDIDYFIGVDVEERDIYIVPIDLIEKYSSSISISKLQKYKNNFTQLEPYDGNIISGEDNIGEPC